MQLSPTVLLQVCSRYTEIRASHDQLRRHAVKSLVRRQQETGLLLELMIFIIIIITHTAACEEK